MRLNCVKFDWGRLIYHERDEENESNFQIKKIFIFKFIF